MFHSSIYACVRLKPRSVGKSAVGAGWMCVATLLTLYLQQCRPATCYLSTPTLGQALRSQDKLC